MQKNKFAHVGDLKIAYSSVGEGETLLLVHGITTYSFIWRQMVPPLAKNFRVITVDLLGCGDSDKPTQADYSISAQADLLAGFLEVLGVNKVHIVSHDIGGGIAQILTVRRPEIVKTLTVINTIGYDYWPIQPIASLRVPIVRELGLAALDHGFFRFLVKRGLFHKDRLNDDLMTFFMAPLKNQEGRSAFLRLAKCLNNQDLMGIVNDIKELDLPTLIIRGDADIYLPAEIAHRLHEDIKGSKLVLIPTGGHFIQEDEPELLVKEIAQFIEGSEPHEIKRTAHG